MGALPCEQAANTVGTSSTASSSGTEVRLRWVMWPQVRRRGTQSAPTQLGRAAAVPSVAGCAAPRMDDRSHDGHDAEHDEAYKRPRELTRPGRNGRGDD